jgi:antitoxin CcdA
MTGAKTVPEKTPELGDGIARADENGPSLSATDTAAQRWLRDNRDALDAWNEYVEQHGLPLAEFRQF